MTAPPRGGATLEVCIASALLGLLAATGLGGATLAQREATLAAVRQSALALAEERLDLQAAGATADDAGWQARVAAALPGGQGSISADAAGVQVQVRWQAPGSSDTRCPGTTCVALRSVP